MKRSTPLQETIAVGQVQAAEGSPEACAAAARKTKKYHEVKRGFATVKVYPGRAGVGEWRKYKTHTIIYRDAAGHRRREKRADLKEALKRAEDIAMAQANGTLDFTLEERKEYELICKLLEGLKKERIVVISEFVEAVKSLEGVGTIQEAVKFFIENRPKSFTPLPIPDLVVQLLLEKQADVGARWYRSLAQHLESFAAYFTGPLHTVASVDINAWLRSLKVGGRPLVARSRHNYRAAVELLVRWAWSNGHLPRSWAELEHVPDPGNKMTSAIIVLTPKDLARLMGARQNMEDGRATMTLIPFLALMAFAGVRHEEIVGVKGRLDWRDIHLDEKQIYIPKGMAKKGEDRTVPIEPVLGAWLAPYAKRSGPICELENTSNALFRTKQAAGIKCGKNETRNALRKSFISYRRAVVKDEAQVALEAGTSVAKIRSNYGRPLAEAEGLRWFSIYPQHADVIQLPLKFA